MGCSYSNQPIGLADPQGIEYNFIERPNIYTKQDTIKALRKLFKRKRKGGTLRGAIGGVFLGSTLGSLAAGTDTSNAAGTAIYIVVFGGLAVSGIVQVSEYREEKLEQLINNYQAGERLPDKIIKKLKTKDFKQ